jgi:predicted O-methyltransferase YrrM
MTGQSSTSLRSRADAVSARPPRGLANLALLGAFCLLNAPFLARSLYGGSRSAKLSLLRGLDLPADALPHTGSWKADVGLLTLLARHIARHRPRSIVEFSTGASTLIAARALERAEIANARMISFEQHRDFCEETRAWLQGFGIAADIRHAPLVAAPGGWPGLWYDHGPLPATIDLLLIDGPPWSIHPFTRSGAATLFDRIAIGGHVILDDAFRPGERIVARRWRRAFPDFDFTLLRIGSKGALLGKRLR